MRQVQRIHHQFVTLENENYERSYKSHLKHPMMYHRQQNNCYPQRCLLAYFEATLDFSLNKIYLPIITKVKFVTAVKFQLQSAAVNCSFSDNLTPLGVGVPLIFCW